MATHLATPKYSRLLPLLTGLVLGWMASGFWNGGGGFEYMVSVLGFATFTIIGAGMLGILYYRQVMRQLFFVLIASAVGIFVGLLFQEQTYDWEFNQQFISNLLSWPFYFGLIHLPFMGLLMVSAAATAHLSRKYGLVKSKYSLH